MHSSRSYLYCLRSRIAQWSVMCVMVFSIAANAEPMSVSISGSSSNNPHDPSYYYTQVLSLALEKTRTTDGDFVLAYHDHKGGIERDRTMLVAGVGIDIMWGSVTDERAQKLRVIDIDLLKGLNNYRVLLINKNAQLRFDKVKTLSDLKAFKAGSGPYWTDGSIMDYNGFSVIYGASYTGLFKMLSMNRFDFLSRGLHEIGNDLEAHGDLGLMQERNLLLTYENPIRYCFFVNKHNEKLAQRVERGLSIAQADGSFDKLFLQMPMFKYGHDILQESNRRVLIIRSAPDL